MFQKSILVLASLILTVSVHADTVRTRLTKENRFPEQFHPEVGAVYNYVDFENGSETWGIDSYIRLGLAEGFAITATIPYLNVEDALTANEESGAGDVRVGVEFRLWEDIFRYPWIIGHIEVDTESGDDEAGLGDGETSTRLGLTVGTVTHDVIHWAAEARYELKDELDDEASGAVSLGYAVSDQLMFMAEVEIRDDPNDSETDSPLLAIGGMFYQINDFISFSVHGGVENSSERESFVSSKVALAF